MSYHIYTTDGIILKRKSSGEGSVTLFVLTESFGLIMASAKSARLSVSKLRPALQEYVYVSISTVKGKNGWKITNVSEKENFFFEYPEHTHKVLAQISQLLLQMIQGETPHKEIFGIVKSGFQFLKSLSKEEIGSFEILSVLRILKELGYVVNNDHTMIFFKNMEEWNGELLKEVSQKKEILVSLINLGLKESQL